MTRERLAQLNSEAFRYSSDKKTEVISETLREIETLQALLDTAHASEKALTKELNSARIERDEARVAKDVSKLACEKREEGLDEYREDTSNMEAIHAQTVRDLESAKLAADTYLMGMMDVSRERDAAVVALQERNAPRPCGECRWFEMVHSLENWNQCGNKKCPLYRELFSREIKPFGCAFWQKKGTL